MKKHLSVLSLIVRSTIYKIIGVLILMAGLEFLLFMQAVSLLGSQAQLGLELAFRKGFTAWFFLAAFIALFFLLTGVVKSKKSNPAYTLLRLSIKEKQFFFWCGLYNTVCFALLILVQIAVVIGLCEYYINSGADSTATGQTVFLAFYRSDFLHSLVPFDEPFNMLANIFLTVVLGFSCAHYSVNELHGKAALWLTYWSIYLAIRGFIRPVDENLYDIYLWIFLAIGAIDIAVYLLKKEAGHEEYEE